MDNFSGLKGSIISGNGEKEADKARGYGLTRKEIATMVHG